MSKVPNPRKTFTAADVAAAFQAGLELGQRAGRPADDGGLAEQFLEDQRALRLMPEQVREAVYGDGPVPSGLDPETIAAARRIARRLNAARQ